MKTKKTNLKQKLLSQGFFGFIATLFFNRHQVFFLHFHLKQAVRTFSGVNINHTYWLVCSSYQNLLWEKVDLSRSASSKNPDQIKIILICSQFIEYGNNIKYYIKHSSKYTNFCYLFSLLHNSKLITEVNTD